MFNLHGKNTSYIIVSPENSSDSEIDRINCEKVYSILYSKDYSVIPIKGYFNGQFENSFIGISNDCNNVLRKDAIFLLEELSNKNMIIKYHNEEYPKMIFSDGSEVILNASIYEINENYKTYIYNGLSFSFTPQKRYRYLSNRLELKNDMIVEYFNNDNWVEKKILNVEIEYNNMYKLLMQYGKLRCSC